MLAMRIKLMHPRFSQVGFHLVQLKKNTKLMAGPVRVEIFQATPPPQFDPNTEVQPLQHKPLLQDPFGPTNLAPFLAPVPDTLPSPLKPTQLGGYVVTPSPTASPSASPAPQLLNLGDQQGEFG
jgi:hypothetical protein